MIIMSYRTLLYMIYGFGHQIPKLGNKRIILYLKGKGKHFVYFIIRTCGYLSTACSLEQPTLSIITKYYSNNFCIFFPNGKGDETNFNNLFSSSFHQSYCNGCTKSANEPY